MAAWLIAASVLGALQNSCIWPSRATCGPNAAARTVDARDKGCYVRAYHIELLESFNASRLYSCGCLGWCFGRAVACSREAAKCRLCSDRRPAVGYNQPERALASENAEHRPSRQGR